MRALSIQELPSLCEVCRQWSRGRLCSSCQTRFATPLPRCDRCALRLDGGAALCGVCLREPPPQQRCRCVADYAFPWDGLIADFKFRDRVDLAPALAALLAQVSTAGPDLVLPVPLSPRRLAQRGYNQAWELARRVARTRRLQADAQLLMRPVDTAHQADLPRAARLANLRAAFVVDTRRRSLLQGRHVALVDDVLTTGATVHEAASALLRAGAAAVDVWVLARTPEH
jgi:ComF family protein